jgi:hypothetical protein
MEHPDFLHPANAEEIGAAPLQRAGGGGQQVVSGRRGDGVVDGAVLHPPAGEGMDRPGAPGVSVSVTI